MYIGLHVSYRLFLAILVKLEFCQHIFEKHSNIKFREKSVQWELSCSMRTDMTKLIVAFHNSANAPNNESETIWERYDLDLL